MSIITIILSLLLLTNSYTLITASSHPHHHDHNDKIHNLIHHDDRTSQSSVYTVRHDIILSFTIIGLLLLLLFMFRAQLCWVISERSYSDVTTRAPSRQPLLNKLYTVNESDVKV